MSKRHSNCCIVISNRFCNDFAELTTNFCKGREAFKELDGQDTDQTEMAVLPLDYVAYCVSLMTNKPHFKRGYRCSKWT